MEQTSTDSIGAIRRALNDPPRNWIWFGILFALLTWAISYWPNSYGLRLAVPLAALVGMGSARVLVHVPSQDELTMPLRLWEGTLSALWFGAWVGLIQGKVGPMSFLVNAALAGIVYSALTVAMKKPYGHRWNFLDLEDQNVFQRGGTPARIAAAWPFLTLALALLVLWASTSPAATILTIAVMLNLAPQYRRPKPRPNTTFWQVTRLIVVAALVLTAAIHR